MKKSFRAGALVAVVALMAAILPAEAWKKDEVCRKAGRCPERSWVEKCLAKTAMAWDSRSATWITLTNNNCFDDVSNVDKISAALSGSERCNKEVRKLSKTGKLFSFKLPKGSRELKLHLYAQDAAWGTGRAAAVPHAKKCAGWDNSERCDLCRFDLTIPVKKVKECKRSSECPSVGCQTGICTKGKCMFKPDYTCKKW